MKKFLLCSVALFTISYAGAQSLWPVPDSKGMFGYADDKEQIIIPCKFDEAQPFVDGTALVKQKGKYGFIKPDGSPIGKGIVYTNIEEYPGTDYYIAAIGGKEEKNVKKIKSRICIDSKGFKGSASTSMSGAKWGFVDKGGNVVLEPQYTEISAIQDNGLIYVLKGYKWGLIDRNFKEVVAPIYTFMSNFNNQGICVVNLNNKLGFIDKSGRYLLNPSATRVGVFIPNNWEDKNPATFVSSQSQLKNSRDGFFWYITSTGFAAIKDNEGKDILPEGKFNGAFIPSEGMVFGYTTVKKQANDMKLYNVETGETIDIPDDRNYDNFSNGFSLTRAIHSRNGYFIDKKGNKCSEEYDTICAPKNGYTVVGSNGNIGLIDSVMNKVIELSYKDALSDVSEGLWGVKKGDKWGFVDTANKEAIPFVYDRVGSFRGNKAYVGIKSTTKSEGNSDYKFGVINKSNKLLVPIEWSDINFKNDVDSYCWVKNDGKFSRFNIKDKTISFKDEFTEIRFGKDGGSFVKTPSNLWGYISKDGNISIAYRLSNIEKADKALTSMKEKGISKLNEIDAYRINIYEGSERNSHKLTEQIPAQEWDY